MTRPPRYKQVDEFSTEEHAERQRAAREGRPPPKFETAEYAATRRRVLQEAGLEDEREEPKDLEDMSAADHFERINRRNR